MDETSGGGSDIINGIFGILGKKIDQQTAAQQATANSAATWAGNNANLAVDEYGRSYLRGAPSSSVSLSSLGISGPAALLGVAAVVGGILYLVLKR